MVTSGERSGRDLIAAVRGWTLWTRPGPWVAVTLSSMAVAVALSVTSAFLVPVTMAELGLFGLLAGLAVAQTEVTRRIERQRRMLSHGPHITVTSVWLLPAALLMPPQLMAALGVVIYLYLAFRSWNGIQPGEGHRVAANATTMILSGFGASLAAFCVGEQGVSTIVAAAFGYFLVNTALTGLGLYLAAPKSATPSLCLGSMDDNVLEAAILCVGGLLTMVLTEQPVLSALVILPLYVLQRSVLIKRLEELATTDQKTQLLNATTWQEGAQREVSRAEREQGTFGALMIDLDHFKHINDTYGHLAGDDVLKAVAAVVRQETRAHDLVGRFGGEEFVALLPATSKEDAVVTADRIRQRISELVIQTHTNEGEAVSIERRTASIGVAAFPFDGSNIEDVMAAADAAVYVAKDSGRNRVVGSPASPHAGTATMPAPAAAKVTVPGPATPLASTGFNSTGSGSAAARSALVGAA
ncbi:sensor domain-containing diguanylate cyclase [Amycolatopsis jiangsuensis]|uniref:Diguanylate cyclase (GGDEF)-like protein n=1 Tax=Amycolatopsis jiangsuensis TaxID=1181879 RepID=A0A840J149_9PSEU|nr:GGDEF domain-containing protein [Amycolatopsis jiangsuensis]MBB4687479.1 diguanylate cyclase (GGDEF)-like protein [Amycolatopsis jiangsuensis]